jgi:aryl-alcohol dehydrogenase-like predicted oxidoreductase
VEGYVRLVNEQLVGEALEPVRDQVPSVTKFGFKIDDRLPEWLDSGPEHIRKVVEASPALRTDHIDLLISTASIRPCRWKKSRARSSN